MDMDWLGETELQLIGGLISATQEQEAGDLDQLDTMHTHAKTVVIFQAVEMVEMEFPLILLGSFGRLLLEGVGVYI
jgi:hypothetical protein